MKRKEYINISLSIAMLIIFAAALLPVIGVNWAGTRYLFAAGAIIAFITRILDRYEGKSIRIKRLHRMETISALCYGVSAFLLFWAEKATDWLAFLTVGAVLQLYTSFMIPYAERKEAEKK